MVLTMTLYFLSIASITSEKKLELLFFYFDVIEGDWDCWEYFNYMF
jgi:hypothetical protein